MTFETILGYTCVFVGAGTLTYWIMQFILFLEHGCRRNWKEGKK